MKRSSIATALLMLLAVVAAADRFTPATGAQVRIEGTSSLHDWKMEGKAIGGHITVPALSDWNHERGLNARVPGEVSVTIPVTSIKSEHAKMDKIMATALRNSAHPTIKYDLVSAVLAQPGATFKLNTRGNLTIAGVTREVEMPVIGTKDESGTWVLSGTLPIRMTDYGIKPPTAMLGTIKTGNDVKVSFRWTVEPKAN